MLTSTEIKSDIKYAACCHRLWPLWLLLLCIASASYAERSPEAMPLEGELTEHFRRMTTYHERMDGSVPEGAVLFIGDSITQGLCVSAVCAHGVNYGIGSDTTAGVIERLPLYTSMIRADAVVLAIGVNDLHRREDKFILENMRVILDAITSDAPVVVSAVLPLDDRVATVGKDRNQRIETLNREIASLCAEFRNCVYVDAFPALVDGEGCLTAAYHVGDGVHPNTAGYEKWIAVLREGVKKAVALKDKQEQEQQ